MCGCPSTKTLKDKFKMFRGINFGISLSDVFDKHFCENLWPFLNLWRVECVNPQVGMFKYVIKALIDM